MATRTVPTIWAATSLTGGIQGALDSIDGKDIIDGDMAIVRDGQTLRAYALDADSGASESSPQTIAPNLRGGLKRWILQGVGAGDQITDVDSYGGLNAAITAIGATPSTVRVTTEQTMTASATIPATLKVIIEQGGSIVTTGYTLTVSGTIDAGPYQIFSGTGTVAGLKEAYFQWFGSGAAALNSAIASLSTGGRLKVYPGTYVITPGTVTAAVSNITIHLEDGANLTTTGTDYMIKTTGDDIQITGPGKITNSATPVVAGAGVTNLRKATIWNTGNRLTVYGVNFVGSASVTIFSESGDDNRIVNNKFFGGYTDYDISTVGNVHFAYYQTNGSRTIFSKNYVEYYVHGFGSGKYSGTTGTGFIITDNQFDHIGQHPAYLADVDDMYSIIANNVQKNCGSSFAVTGNYVTVANNLIHLASSLWTAGTDYQGGLSMRDSIGCIVKGNTFTGEAGLVIIGFESIGATAITDNIVEGNIIAMSTGEAYAGIRIGTAATSDDVSRNIISGNKISTPIAAAYASSGTIKLTAKAADEVNFNQIAGNTINAQSASVGIQLDYGAFNQVKNNTLVNATATGAIYGIQVVQAHDNEVSGNVIYNLPTAGTTFYGAKEYGTNAQVYNNRYFGNKIYSATTTTNFLAITLIAGNGSQVKDLYGNEALNLDTGTTFRLHHGQVFHLTASGGARNFNPSTTDVWPVNYQVEVYNNDGTNAITFDQTVLNVSIAAGKHGVFNYNGTEWKGSQID